MNKTLIYRQNKDIRTKKLKFFIEENWATKWAQVAKRKSRNGSKLWRKFHVQRTENIT